MSPENLCGLAPTPAHQPRMSAASAYTRRAVRPNLPLPRSPDRVLGHDIRGGVNEVVNRLIHQVFRHSAVVDALGGQLGAA
jgi:hypothetical protein